MRQWFAIIAQLMAIVQQSHEWLFQTACRCLYVLWRAGDRADMALLPHQQCKVLAGEFEADKSAHTGVRALHACTSHREAFIVLLHVSAWLPLLEF